jgi:hypothetical protein
MEAYKRGSHTVWDCKYHLVWITKYRHPVLGGDIGIRCPELLRETGGYHFTKDDARSPRKRREMPKTRHMIPGTRLRRRRFYPPGNLKGVAVCRGNRPLRYHIAEAQADL